MKIQEPLQGRVQVYSGQEHATISSQRERQIPESSTANHKVGSTLPRRPLLLLWAVDFTYRYIFLAQILGDTEGFYFEWGLER